MHGRCRRYYRFTLPLMLATIVLCASGCTSSRMIRLLKEPASPLAERLNLASWSGPQATPRTVQFLRVNDLERQYDQDQFDELLPQVETIAQRTPSAENVYCMAELAFLAAKNAERHKSDQAFGLYGTSLKYSYLYLFDPQYRTTRNPYDPQFRGACDLYNGSLESALRLHLASGGDFRPGTRFTIRSEGKTQQIKTVFRHGRWRPEDIDRFMFASDYEIKGLKNHYRRYGLGVPLIAVRKSYEGEPAYAQYYAPNLSFPITAFLRPVLPGDCSGESQGCDAILEMYDSLAVRDIRMADRYVPLESDLSTPLAWFLTERKLNMVAKIGFLQPDRLLLGSREWTGQQSKPIKGIYMVQPYEPDKIPVLMVHGLGSSPMTWMPMFNDLRSSPELCENYQFWFYLYPSAQPFWVSAAQMRNDLAELRATIDPNLQQPALDYMVLIGHSMGGLVSRLQTIESDDRFWNLISDAPPQEIRGNPQIRDELESYFYFRPSPSIRRVVTIATPHRGSDFSNGATQWASGLVISIPKTLNGHISGFTRENRDLIRDDRLLKIDTSVGSLAPDSPFFPEMLECEHPPWIKFNNIIGIMPQKGVTGYFAGNSDGVVRYESAHMDDTESELIVTASHTTIQTQPSAVMEVRRILHEHLDEIRTGRSPSPAYVRAALGYSDNRRYATNPPPVNNARPMR